MDINVKAIELRKATEKSGVLDDIAEIIQTRKRALSRSQGSKGYFLEREPDGVKERVSNDYQEENCSRGAGTNSPSFLPSTTLL